MTDDRSWLKRFFEDFGKVPETEPRQFIPDEMRIPVFVGMIVVSLVLLGLLLWFVVIPAIKAQPPVHSQAPAQLAASRA